MDAVEYYMNEEVEMRVKYDQHMEKVLEGPLSIAFLTFTHEGMAIRSEFCCCKRFEVQLLRRIFNIHKKMVLKRSYISMPETLFYNNVV